MVLLDTYQVSMHYKSKFEIIRLCWRLTEICDDFLIMYNKPLQNLAEALEIKSGAIGEICAWLDRTRAETIKYVNFDTEEETTLKVDNDRFFEELLNTDSAYYSVYKELKTKQHSNIPLEYILTERKDYINLGAIISNAYINEKIPMIPSYFLKELHYFKNLNSRENKILYRLAIALRCDQVCIYLDKPFNDFNLEDLSNDILIEIALIRKFRPELPIYFQDLNDMHILLRNGHLAPKAEGYLFPYQRPFWKIRGDKTLENSDYWKVKAIDKYCDNKNSRRPELLQHDANNVKITKLDFLYKWLEMNIIFESQNHNDLLQKPSTKPDANKHSNKRKRNMLILEHGIFKMVKIPRLPSLRIPKVDDTNEDSIKLGSS